METQAVVGKSTPPNDPSRTPAMASLITCSYSGDFDVCGMLCRSIDRFVPQEIEHRLYVPRREIPLFSAFASPRRKILAQEDLLAPWFWKAPLPRPQWRERLGLSRRNLYLTPYSLPVRGWIAQQIMKLSATLNAPTDVVAHLDSDIVIVRPLTIAHLMRDAHVRFHAQRASAGIETQRPWYATAARLLGLPPADYSANLYIDQIVVWRRVIVEGLVARIEASTGRDWQVALARTPQFAEYVLYGMFVDHVLGPDAAGVYVEPDSLCYSRWTQRFSGAEEEDAFVRGLPGDQVACLIQSTIPMAIEERARVFDKATQWARQTDARAA